MIQKCLSLNSIHFIDVIYNAFAIMYHGILSTAEWYAFWYICTPLYTFQHIAIIFRNYIWNPCGMQKAAHLSYHHYYNNLISIFFQSNDIYLVFQPTLFVYLKHSRFIHILISIKIHCHHGKYMLRRGIR